MFQFIPIPKNANEIIKMIDAYWKFDNNQQPMASWHDKQDLLEALTKQLQQADVMESLPPVTDSDIDTEAIRRWDLTSKWDFVAGAKWMREKLSGGNAP